MLSAFAAIVLSQLVLMGLAFGTILMDRPHSLSGFLRRHPVLARRADSWRSIRRHRAALDELGAAVDRLR